jgi:hypothetical protein
MIDLSAFYVKYQKFLLMLYANGRVHWGLRGDEFPDLKEITKFSIIVKASESA